MGVVDLDNMLQRDDDVDGQLHRTTKWSSNKVNLLQYKW